MKIGHIVMNSKACVMTLKLLGSRNFIGPLKEALGIVTGNELLRNKFSYHVCIYGKTLIKRAHRYLGESRLNKIWTLCPPDRFDHDVSGEN